MRGRSSSAKARLRSAGYKCNICGRRLIDAATLVRHQKTVHKVSPRDNKVSLKPKSPAKRPKLTVKEKDKIFDELLKDTPPEPKPKSKKPEPPPEPESPAKSKPDTAVKNGQSLLLDKDKKIKDRKVVFECPVCAKPFSVYFNAHKHIQRSHCVNADGEKVDPKSSNLIQPIRLEQCYRCDNQIRSNEDHVCPKSIEEHISVIAEFICSGCNQIFVSLKSFDMHVAGLHSDSVDSMFFPTKLEFMTWRLEMERQTNAKYTLYGEYELKKVYRCNYARNDTSLDKYTAYFCPSSIVVQEFSKGIQVHYYNKHYDHQAYPYMLSSKYKKYSITSFLKNANDTSDETTIPSVYNLVVDEKDLLSQFKKLMDTIIINAADVNVVVLKKLIEKALEMSAVVTEAGTNVVLKTPKTISDKEITEELEMTTVPKRRKSVESSDEPKPAKRTRNKSLISQNDYGMSPKILNIFSLASNSEENKTKNGDLAIATNEDKKDTQSKKPELEKTNQLKINTRLSSFNESLSFNDSYKDFIDKNFIGKTPSAEKTNTVKTKLGTFKQMSPRNIDTEDMSYDMPLSKRIGMKPIPANRSKTDEDLSKKDTDSTETAKINVLSVETPNLTMTKISSKVDTPKVADSKVNTSKVNTRAALSLVDPLQVKVTKLRRRDSSPQTDSSRSVLSKTRRGSTPLTDPLELNIPKTKKNVNLEQKSMNSRNTTPLEDPLKVNTVKVINKVESPKVYAGPGSPKVVKPKVGKVKFVDKVTKLVPSVKELKYEVREQENDCNILVLKF